MFLSWDTQDQDKALAWLRDQSARCSGCGTRKDEWVRDKFAYVVHTEQCPGCEQVEAEHEEMREDAHRKMGVKVTLIPRGLALSMIDEGAYDERA